MDKKAFMKIVHASILGNGYFYKIGQLNNKKAHTVFCMQQLAAHKDYIDFMVCMLENLTAVKVNYTPAYTNKHGFSSPAKYDIVTKRHPLYKKMFNRLYRLQNNIHIKTLDPHYIKFIDWQTLAILYMDSGLLETKQQKGWVYIRTSIFTTQFTYAENKLLRDFIANKFGVHFNIKTKRSKSGLFQYYLSCSKDNSKRFISGISNFTLPSFNYKIQYD